MPNKLVVLIFILLTGISCFSANSTTVINHIKSEADRLHLSEDPYWYKLLHYRYNLFGNLKSDIISKDYFLSKNGNSDSKNELDATIDLFFLPESENKNKSSTCRFISRYEWLKKRLSSTRILFPNINCPAYNQWTRNQSVKSISLIFATGFLGNPASYFGHPLMKLNFKDETSPIDLLDSAINYGAFSPPDENAILYALKGLFGGYSAGFTSTKFFFHRYNYSELELRDMWEYELDLTEDQVKQIVNHLWDTMSMQFPYYFTHDNCAYRMSELLNLVIDTPLTPQYAPYSIPSTIFHRLNDNKLVKNYHVIDSRQSRLIDKFMQLSLNEKEQVNKLVTEINFLDSIEFNLLDDDSKIRILETAFDYYEYQIILQSQNDELKLAKNKLLVARLALPAKKTEWITSKKSPPHEAQLPVLTELKIYNSNNFGTGLGLRFRPVYYDLISPDAGRLPYSSLTLFDTELNMINNRSWLQTLNFLTAETLNMPHSNLKGDGGYAWRFKFGLEQLDLSCTDCLIFRFEAGLGKALEISKTLTIYAMIDPRIQTVAQQSGSFSGTTSIAALITPNHFWRFHVTAAKRYFANGLRPEENIYSIENRIGFSRFWDLRINYQEHIDRRLSLGYSHYW